MTPTFGPAGLKELVAGVRAKKSLGQNFLIRPDVLDKIVAAADITEATTVVEIGPGPGSLTRWLLDSPALKLIAVEKDTSMAAYLDPLVHERFEVVYGDALKLPFWSLGTAPRVAVANLPYNVATPLLIRMLDHRSAFQKLVLMFQKEVALRLLAQPDTSDYGRLAVLTQLLCVVESVVTVPPSAFQPAPKIMSMVVSLTPRPAPLFEVNVPALTRLLHKAFQQRRKMLRASLKGFVDDPLALLHTADIDPTRRPETLTVEEFCRLTNCAEVLLPPYEG